MDNLNTSDFLQPTKIPAQQGILFFSDLEHKH